ncbi:MAG TPA: hybrid sensor histidine kinase/response regulator [Burkholderiales bacterium]|jgi:signal transduction histidine kinase/ActR/RegA family two-component response regulator|nr:hybrid sensor histidine kinase/response regulator [Burkholderiales bacterium]
MKIRPQLVLLTLGSSLLALGLGGLAAWTAAQAPFPLSEDTAWRVALCIAGAVLLPLILGLLAARRISASISALAAIPKSLLRGTKPEIPENLKVREAAQCARILVQASSVALGREAALRAADRSKDEFIAMLGHELRNPLGTLSAAAYVLSKPVLKEGNGERATAIVERQVQHMSRLIEDLLDVNRVTRGKVSLNRQPLNLAQVVDKAMREWRLSGQMEKHELRLELDEVWARADEARFEQIVSNLVGNAVKYTPEGGRIAVTLRRDRDTVVLRVHDSGVGMPPELAARVFDLFMQGEAAQQRGRGGLGIGLTLVKHLAELHGGKAFAASSGPGQGSVFTITLPAIEPRLEQADAAANGLERQPHRVLLIEDNDDVRRSLSSALAADGHKVCEAATAATGLEAAQRFDADVAIVDLKLPDLDGYQVAEKLRTHPNLALIALTGYGRPDSRRRAQDAGFDEFVTKPIAPDRLARLMDVALAARQRRGEARNPA